MNLAKQPFRVLYPRVYSVPSDPVTIDFSRGAVHYVVSVERFKHEKPKSLLIAGRVILAPGTEFVVKGRKNGEGLEANFRPFFLRNMVGASARWWCNQCVFLNARGDFQIRSALAPENWTDVYGKRPTHSDTTRAGWRKTLEQSHVGVTFGGGNAYGHGVFLSRGWCTVEIDTFRVD